LIGGVVPGLLNQGQYGVIHDHEQSRRGP
jgi:hypothetical protein